MKLDSYIIQIHTGSFQKPSETIDAMKRKLRALLQKLPCRSVIMGWNTDREMNRQLLALFREFHLECFLWLPALAEAEGLKECRNVTNCIGIQGDRVACMEGENFQFYCPEDSFSAEHLKEIYEEYFADLPFDGVFLDKIRFPSFANSYEDGFGCFCPSCKADMIRNGIDVRGIQDRIARHDLSLVKGEYADGIYRFDDKAADDFYRVRSEQITGYVGKLTEYFRAKGLKVGLDIFAPFFAYHVGQNIKELTANVDFIKPMMYRFTAAPAGVKYEYDAYMRYFDPKNPFAACWHEDPSSVNSIRRQKPMLDIAKCEVYPGIEINPTGGSGGVDEKKLKENLELYAGLGYRTLACCWNCLQISDSFVNILRRAAAETE